VWPEAEPNRIKPMELLNTALQTPFVWGLLLGLLITGFVWKSGFSARRNLAREIKRLEAEIKDMQKHLNTQLKINASGNETLQTELDLLRLQNENLREQCRYVAEAGARRDAALASARGCDPYDARTGSGICCRMGKCDAPGRGRTR